MRVKNLFLILSLAGLPLKAQGGAPTPEDILAKAEAFEAGIEKATFQFEEEFILIPTNEREKVKGRVYLNRKTSNVRVNYGGAVKAKVWMDEKRVYFYDESLKQAVIRDWEDFRHAHFQAFMDIPILQGMAKFKQRFNFKVISSSGTTAELSGVPKGAVPSYEIRVRFDPQSGQPQGLSLLMENYKAHLKILKFDKSAKFGDSIFKKEFPEDAAILDMTKEKR